MKKNDNSLLHFWGEDPWGLRNLKTTAMFIRTNSLLVLNVYIGEFTNRNFLRFLIVYIIIHQQVFVEFSLY